jgi:hypothetical protein
MADQVRINGRVNHTSGTGPVEKARIRLFQEGHPDKDVHRTQTTEGGNFELAVALNFDDAPFIIETEAFGRTAQYRIGLDDAVRRDISLDLHLGFRLTIFNRAELEGLQPTNHAVAGHRIIVRAETAVDNHIDHYVWKENRHAEITALGKEAEIMFPRPGNSTIQATIVEKTHGALAKAWIDIPVSESDVQTIGGHVRVSLERAATDCTLDQALWVAIREGTHRISFNRYYEFLARVLTAEEDAGRGSHRDIAARDGNELEYDVRGLRSFSKYFRGVGSYRLLKYLTEAFLVLQSGVRIDHEEEHRYEFDRSDEGQRLGVHCREDLEGRLREYLGDQQLLPYLRRVVEAAFPEFERELRHRNREVRGADRLILAARLDQPMLVELMHTYWLEEGMLMQTMNAINRRFQNIGGDRNRDPLANMAIDPLRLLSPLLWGWNRDEIHHLSVRDRAHEYANEYGLVLVGSATRGIRPAESRSAFMAAFNNLLYQSSIFFKEDYQTTVIADGFQLLNALKEVHLVLSQGAANAFGDMPYTARVETLMMQFILARPEMREFLQTNASVTYNDKWMPAVDAMKTLQGWSDVTITHFRDLAVYGEQLLLSVRYGDWVNVNDEDSAKNWGRYWRAEVQGYLHAYRAVTGVDLSNAVAAGMVDSTLPAIHLQKRLEAHARAKTSNMLEHAPAADRLDMSKIPYLTRRPD